jgi:hypothetical protein
MAAMEERRIRMGKEMTIEYRTDIAIGGTARRRVGRRKLMERNHIYI